MLLHWLDGGFNKLQLDIVGFLAILGESSVLVNAQVSTLSSLFLLPRLIPAPQALIRTARPERLAPSTGRVAGSKSGLVVDTVNHVAHLLHDWNGLPAYSVRCQRVTRDTDKPGVTARILGPLTFLSILGCLMSTALLVLSIIERDGMALLATILLSLVSTLIGIGSGWSLILKQRLATRKVPESDVVIVYPNGSYLIVKCSEEIARELYFAPEECIYRVEPTTYRVLSLIATIMLMFGVICLGNAGLTLQVCFAAAYLILNAAYWTVAALPQQWNWDLSCFCVQTIPYYTSEENGTREENGASKEDFTGEKSKSFTMALWKAIAITQSTEWVINARRAPQNDAWRRWLKEAGSMANTGHKTETDKAGRNLLPDWDFDKALTSCLEESAEQAV
ncbi:hypothetical protein MMC07_006459 [Pseudocyphellaria aurata]|nr:hypothetical protein [Pseudocyphellaria aurata]